MEAYDQYIESYVESRLASFDKQQHNMIQEDITTQRAALSKVVERTYYLMVGLPVLIMLAVTAALGVIGQAHHVPTDALLHFPWLAALVVTSIAGAAAVLIGLDQHRYMQNVARRVYEQRVNAEAQREIYTFKQLEKDVRQNYGQGVG